MGSSDKQLSEYTPRKVLKRRVDRSKAHDDKYSARVVELLDKDDQSHMPVFRDEFDDFANEIAYGLRHKILYRTDGGRFARGLVRANGQLKAIHDLYKVYGRKEGTPVDITIIIVRRMDLKPTQRWVMDVLYRVNDIIDYEGDTVVADSERVTDARCLRLDKIINAIEAQLKDAGPKAEKEIQGMIDVAERVGCPDCFKLWYFNRRALKDYIHWRTTDKYRRYMTSKTDGKFPFDGHVDPYGNWRIYPFWRLLHLYGHGSVDEHARAIFNLLLYHRNQIVEELRDMNREVNTTGMARSWMTIPGFKSGANAMYGLAVPFFKDMKDLRSNKNHLYSVF